MTTGTPIAGPEIKQEIVLSYPSWLGKMMIAGCVLMILSVLFQIMFMYLSMRYQVIYLTITSIIQAVILAYSSAYYNQSMKIAGRGLYHRKNFGRLVKTYDLAEITKVERKTIGFGFKKWRGKHSIDLTFPNAKKITIEPNMINFDQFDVYLRKYGL